MVWVAPSTPHFHRVDQFQVVVAGGGRLGREPLDPVAVHYTDGFTPYGPIVPSPGGDIWFFTLRARPDAGAFYMPASRDKLEREAGRGLAVHVSPHPGRLLYRSAASVRDSLWEPHADGLAAFLSHAGPGAAVDGPDPGAGGGQYHVVIHGSMVLEGRELPLWSCVFVAPGGSSLKAAAGASGLGVLALQFPRREDLTSVSPDGDPPPLRRQRGGRG